MNKFTPGPWQFKQEGYFKYIGSVNPAGIWFGGRSSISNEEHLANISLVVAAPDLLEALELLFKSVDICIDSDVMHKAQSAIAKARGL